MRLYMAMKNQNTNYAEDSVIRSARQNTGLVRDGTGLITISSKELTSIIQKVRQKARLKAQVCVWNCLLSGIARIGEADQPE